MLPTARDLHLLAQESRFEARYLEKVIRLAELLDGIEALADLQEALALKGGTAINLLYGPPSRLSVDLDFNFMGAESRDAMLVARSGVESRLQAVARSQGYGVQVSADAHAGRKLFLRYSRLSDGQSDRVEIDVNFLHRVCILPTERRRIWRPDSEGSWVTLLSWAEIAAGKLVALLDRAAPRDAWDVARLPLLSPMAWPPPELRGIFVAVAGMLPRPLHEYGRHSLDRIANGDVARLLWPLLVGGERPTAEALREAAWVVLAPLLDLNEAERQFCDRLQTGALQPELLFPARPDVADRVRRHPALLWKAQNALGHVTPRPTPRKA